MPIKEKTAGVASTDGLECVLLDGTNNPERSLTDLQAQYLAEVFSLSPDSANTIAFLAFGEVSP